MGKKIRGHKLKKAVQREFGRRTVASDNRCCCEMMLMLGDHSASFPVRTHPVAEEEAAADEDEPVLASKYLLLTYQCSQVSK